MSIDVELILLKETPLYTFYFMLFSIKLLSISLYFYLNPMPKFIDQDLLL